MKWISVKRKKPEAAYDTCLVTNERYGTQIFQALYRKDDDVFYNFDPNTRDHYPLDVTHWMSVGCLPYIDRCRRERKNIERYNKRQREKNPEKYDAERARGMEKYNEAYCDRERVHSETEED